MTVPSRVRPSSVALTVGLTLLIASPVLADDDEEPWYKKVELHAFVSSVYSYNFNDPVSGTSQLRVFDSEHDNFDIDGEFVVLMPVKDGGDAGFRMDLEAGSTIPRLEAARGLFRDPETGKAEDVDLQQAFVSYIAPIGNGLRFDFGKCVTPAGAELIEGYDGYNDLHTHSFLFGYAIPFTHTGIHITYPWSDHFSSKLLILNGWDNVKDNNDGKTVGIQFAVTTDKVSFYVQDIYGPEQDDNTSNKRQLCDLVGVFKLGGSFTLTGNVDIASEEGVAADGGTANWSGAALSARWDATDKFALSFRAERFKDDDGVRTGNAQTLTEFTICPSVKLGKGFVLRGDLRLDSSDIDAFEKDREGEFTDHQASLSLNALFAF